MTKVVAMIHGTIGAKNGVSAKGFKKSFADALAKTAEGESVEVHIASDGGNVAEGNFIINEIRQSEKPVTTYNDSVAYSMAALIFLAGTERLMAKNSLLMIHEGKMGAGGTSNELRDAADVLDKYNHTLAETLAHATGMSTDDVKAKWFDGKDHFFTADEAVEAGLATGITDYAAENMPTNILDMTPVQVAAHFGFNTIETTDYAVTDEGNDIEGWDLYLVGSAFGSLTSILSLCDDLENSSNQNVADWAKRLSVANAAFVAELGGLIKTSEMDDMPAAFNKNKVVAAADVTAIATELNSVKAELKTNAEAKAKAEADAATALKEAEEAKTALAELKKKTPMNFMGTKMDIQEADKKATGPYADFKTAFPEMLEERKRLTEVQARSVAMKQNKN